MEPQVGSCIVCGAVPCGTVLAVTGSRAWHIAVLTVLFGGRVSEAGYVAPRPKGTLSCLYRVHDDCAFPWNLLVFEYRAERAVPGIAPSGLTMPLVWDPPQAVLEAV